MVAGPPERISLAGVAEYVEGPGGNRVPVGVAPLATTLRVPRLGRPAT